MPEITITPPVGGSQQDLLSVALGTQFQPFNPDLAVSTTAPTSGSVFGTATYCAAGFTVTGVKMRNAVAAAGTLPTTARFGIANAAGTMLAISANLNALANWTTGVNPFPVFTTGTTRLVIPSSGVYFPCFIVNGTWSVTQPTLTNAGGNAAANAADGANPPPVFAWSGQTDLPAVGAALTLNQTGRAFWLGVY